MYRRMLDRELRFGTLELRFADGSVERYGDGPPLVEWRLRDRSVLGRIARDPGLSLGETYMQGEWDVGEGGLLGLLEVLIRNFAHLADPQPDRLAARVTRLLLQLNRVARSYRNVAHHYDLDRFLFERFLDEDMQYSCAYFAEPGMSLEAAQRAKCRLVAAKLLLEPDHHVLDIGCGWGGLGLHLAREAGVRVTGITLSREQHRVAEERARAEGLAERVEFLLEDYREHRCRAEAGRYDRVVSVGMFEHVGLPYYVTFFERVRELLAYDGVALLHTIGRSTPPSITNAWIRKYIFPGGYIPSLSETGAAIERSRLLYTDTEILRLHYAETLAAWAERFRRYRDEIAAQKGERFCRMWEFYLASCEASFRWWDLVVFQVQLARRHGVVPTTRDYLYGREARACAPMEEDRGAA